MTTHTPGPWRFEDEFIRAGRYDTGGGNVVADPYTMPSADHAEEMEANGRLIAAAPDMLAALENLVAWGEAVGVNMSVQGDRARAAIAKAKGE